MKLSARPLIEVCNVNDFNVSQQLELNVGDATTLYLQLVDLEKNKAQYGWFPAGMRYVPAANTTLTLTFLNIDSAKEFSRTAVQPFAQDGSIWSVPILSTDPISGTISIRAVMNEGAIIRTFSIQGCLLSKV
jgi:hypothetical protein